MTRHRFFKGVKSISDQIFCCSLFHRELAHKILVTGKSINFLKDIYDERTIIKGRKELKEYLESNGKRNDHFDLVSFRKEKLCRSKFQFYFFLV